MNQYLRLTLEHIKRMALKSFPLGYVVTLNV